MNVKKRNGEIVEFEVGKITSAIKKAMPDGENIEDFQGLIGDIKFEIKTEEVSVEEIQDIVEKVLMKRGLYKVAKNYILYRDYRTRQREKMMQIVSKFVETDRLYEVLLRITKDFRVEVYSMTNLLEKFESFYKSGLSDKELLTLLVKSAVEMISAKAPKYEFIASRILLLKHEIELEEKLNDTNITSFYDKITYLTDKKLYGAYILENYSKEEIDYAETFLQKERNLLFNYSGLELLLSRYLIKDFDLKNVEDISEMFLGIALHLGMSEKDKRMDKVQEFYDLLSTLKVTVATPTLSNARKPFHQLSSCFIDTVHDSLDGIYRTVDNFAKVSKYGGGMGVYFGKVRAMGSTIRGYKGAAGGVIRWVKLMNDTAVAVDQLGVRQGSVAVYLDAWHKDLPEFLGLRTNNGDDRMKAHDVFPAICFPDLFWKLAKSDIDANWNLFCPHEVKTVMGYSLEDCYGEEWEQKYHECVAREDLTRRVMSVKEIVRLIIKSAVETGTPFIFNRDIVNKMNPNKHKGVIYSSNLCTEIAQNMSSSEFITEEITEENGDQIVTTRVKAGDFVVCNLASITLGRIDVNNKAELEHVVKTTVRMLDNVLELNFYPVPYAKITNTKYRPIGLGTSGYHHMLVNNEISFESVQHLEFAERVYENINYFAIKASNELAEEKGSYSEFEGSEWHTGKYFDRRYYTSDKWLVLKEQVKKKGMRNGYLLAVAPTGSTSIISGTSAGVDPIMNKYFLEEKNRWLIPKVAPDLSEKNFWFYKSAHTIDQNYVIRSAGVRQRHIDQAQSMNLYITTEFSFRQILDLYIKAYENGLKSIYYVRSKSLEIDDCDSCSS